MWLERKILPDSLLRRYMDEIGVSNDDTTISLSIRRPSRSERAVDDPIREMEGMLVDEYGRCIYSSLYLIYHIISSIAVSQPVHVLVHFMVHC